MLKAKKKIVRKEVQQDDLIQYYQRARSYYDVNKRYFSYGVVALIAIIVGSYVYFHHRQTNNEIAATELGKIYAIYDKGATDPTQFKIAIEGQPQRNIMGLQTIVDNYGGSRSGEIARFYLANAEFALGKIDDALQNYKKYSGDDNLMSASAEAGIAACYEAKKNFSDAAAHFEKAASIVSDTYNTPGYLNEAAHAYAEAGDKDKALALYQRLRKEFPTSDAGHDADRYIAQLSA
jgi:tetratricopeptide (TPR) repeat protein